MDDRDVTVVRYRDPGDDPDLPAGRDAADFAGVGESEVGGAVGLQGDVLRLLPGGEVEGDDPRRRVRGGGRQGEDGGRGQHGADLLDAQGNSVSVKGTAKRTPDRRAFDGRPGAPPATNSSGWGGHRKSDHRSRAKQRESGSPTYGP
ncbi:hypothetical protein Amsp01_005800 [Amycolatopsis sp. NBRC 101858]|nr:hypothetical protein Amsp01_005800 [Amycolatopsis sp. NBRC 101858]